VTYFKLIVTSYFYSIFICTFLIGMVKLPEYVPTDKKYVLTDHGGAGDDCVKITNVPLGTHVLSIKTDPAYPAHVTTLSHVIVF